MKNYFNCSICNGVFRPNKIKNEFICSEEDHTVELLNDDEYLIYRVFLDNIMNIQYTFDISNKEFSIYNYKTEDSKDFIYFDPFECKNLVNRLKNIRLFD